jgi:hypothetical protein
MILQGFESTPVVRFARVIEIKPAGPVDPDAMRGKVSLVLARLTGRLKEHGCALIGHIKAYLDSTGDGGILFSVTAFGQEPQCTGEITGDILNAKLILNVVVFGISEKLVKETVEESMNHLTIFRTNGDTNAR